jgi:hypothetical protein
VVGGSCKHRKGGSVDGGGGGGGGAVGCVAGGSRGRTARRGLYNLPLTFLSMLWVSHCDLKMKENA